MRSPEEIIELYRENGFRVTPQRHLIFKVLAEDRSHPTVEDVYQQVHAQMPEISRSTVYNTLHELEGLGELLTVENKGEGGTRYDPLIQPHHHLYCQRCHQLTDIFYAGEWDNLLPEKNKGFKIDRVQITYYGLCSDCQQNG